MKKCIVFHCDWLLETYNPSSVVVLYMLVCSWLARKTHGEKFEFLLKTELAFQANQGNLHLGYIACRGWLLKLCLHFGSSLIPQFSLHAKTEFYYKNFLKHIFNAFHNLNTCLIAISKKAKLCLNTTCILTTAYLSKWFHQQLQTLLLAVTNGRRGGENPPLWKMSLIFAISVALLHLLFVCFYYSP